MSTPSDPDQPSYDQQGLPHYPAAPPATDTPVRQVTPPTEIMAAFWCYVVGAVVTAVGGLLVLGQRPDLVAATRTALANQQFTDAQIQQVVNFTIVVTVVLALVFAGLYGFFAVKLRAGRNWGRIVLAIVAGLALISLLLGGTGVSVLRLVGDLSTIVGAALSFLPNSNAYIDAVKTGSR